MILLLISFFAGVLTILAPCTLPLLPVIIGSSVNGELKGRDQFRKAFVIASSLGLSVIAFTLRLKASTVFINIPQEVWSFISGIIIVIFGLINLFPNLWEKVPFIAKLNRSSNKLMAVGYKKQGFWGDVIIGASLGPVFSTCSPTYFVILATVLPQSFFLGFINLLAYAIGLAGILLVVAYLGQKLVDKLGGLSDTRGWFKKSLGIFFILIGIAIMSGIDKKIETKLLQSGIFNITGIEHNLLELRSPSNVSNGQILIAPEIVKPSGFINTNGRPITLGELKGNKVVLLDVWTYSCINCQRTIPYLNAWYDKYREYGLEIIGLHTPEFAFERVQSNVEKEVTKFGIQYPVILDNDYSTWNAYKNQFWPRKYLVSVNGEIIYDHIGEGGYAETEREIQKALIELNKSLNKSVVIPMGIVNPNGVASVEAQKVKSPEVYFGAGRNVLLQNGKAQLTGEQKFNYPSTLETNKLYLEGNWKIGVEEAVTLGPSKIIFKYNAKNVYMVASSKLPEGSVITIKKDGQIYKTITVTLETLYPLIEANEYGEHVLEIEIPQAQFEVFTFTFG